MPNVKRIYHTEVTVLGRLPSWLFTVSGFVAALLFCGCAKQPAQTQPVPVAVDDPAVVKGGEKPSAKEGVSAPRAEAPASVVDRKALAAAGRLHPGRVGGGAGALPPGHPSVLPEGHPSVGGAAAGLPNAQPQVRKGYVNKRVAEKIGSATGEGAVTVAKLHADKRAVEHEHRNTGHQPRHEQRREIGGEQAAAPTQQRQHAADQGRGDHAEGGHDQPDDQAALKRARPPHVARET